MYFVCAVPTLFLSSYNVFSFGSESSTYIEKFGQLDLLGKSYVLFSNMTIFLQDWSLFLQADWNTGALSFTSNFNAGSHPIVARLLWNAPAWSLGIELIFYLIAPFVVRHPLRVILLTAASLLARLLIGMNMQMGDPWTYRFMPSELCMFGFGSIAYHVHRSSVTWVPFTLWRHITMVLGMIGLSFLIVAIAFHTFGSGLWRSSESLFLYSPLLLLVIALFVGPIFSLTKNSKLDRWLGDMSYPSYLAHVGVFSAMTAMGYQIGIVTILVFTVSTLLIAAALLWLVDGPVAYFRKSRLHAQRQLKLA